MGASIIKTASQRSKIMASSLPGRGGFFIDICKARSRLSNLQEISRSLLDRGIKLDLILWFVLPYI